jgi:beta-galactosidase
VVDAAGTVVPTSGIEIAFEVTGAGTLAGVDSGNVESTYPYKGSTVDSYFGRAQAIVKSGRIPGPITVKVRADGLPEQKFIMRSTS